jgi:hypothetical protein
MTEAHLRLLQSSMSELRYGDKFGIPATYNEMKGDLEFKALRQS